MKLIIRNFFRLFQRFRVAMSLNILGLSVAFIAFMLLMMQWDYDRTFDRHDPNADKIYRIDALWQGSQVALASRPMAEMFMQSSPHILKGCLLNFPEDNTFQIDRSGTQHMFRETLISVTPEISDVFQFDMAEGDTKSIVDEKQCLIPQSMAQRWFGSGSAVGKMAVCNGQSLTVGGVYRDFPNNSSLRNAVYISMGDENKNEWGNMNYTFYVQADFTDVAEMHQLLDTFMQREELTGSKGIFEQMGVDIQLTALALPEIHSFGPVLYDSTPRATRQTVIVMISIAIVILVIAGINFTNFNTAISPLRMKNINTQKVLGATNGELQWALIVESVLVSLFAFVAGVFILWNLEHTGINQLVKADICVWHHPYLLLITVGIAALVGALAGAYPAYYTTSFEPALVLKGSFGLSPKGRMLRSLLMSVQFIASFALIIASAFMFLQNRYAKTASLGFDKEMLILSDMNEQTMKERKVLQDKLLGHPEIVGVTFAQNQIGNKEDIYPNWGREYQDHQITYNALVVADNFNTVMGIQPLEGRSFREGDGRGAGAYLINRRMADEYDMQIGDKINDAEIIGIVPDFIYRSMRLGNVPTAMLAMDENGNFGSPYHYLYVKTAPGTDLTDALQIVRSELNAISPDYPFNVRFFDDVLNQLYEDEQRLTTLITLFSLLAVFISVVGVFGLVVFDSESRRKEIGIRKVLGSTTSEILLMFNKSYAYILVICFIIAAPLAWYAVDGWLQNFAYKIPIYWWVFPLAFVLVSVVTLLTVTYQNWHAANENPVNSIKNE